MDSSLRVLMIEDLEADAQLLLHELQRGGYSVEYQRVETRAGLQSALSKSEWDMILCDYSLPQFRAEEALAMLKESGLDIPFIVISGVIDEETAVTTLKAGAHDFMVKGRLARLLPAIKRELRDAETRRLHREAATEREKLKANMAAINAEIERFTYLTFHDLRAPLVTMKGFLGMVRQDLQNGKQEHVQEHIERISCAVDKMDALLSGLLKLARLGRASPRLEDVDLAQVTREAVESLDARLRSHNITVQVSSQLPTIQGDRERLREVMENLIENAAKSTEGSSNPRIEVGAVTQNGQPTMFVKDNGLGIDPRYHNRIFNLFEKLDPMGEGTGIGLALVKRIIELHGGRIWVESEGHGHGATFFFTLPESKKEDTALHPA